MNKNVFKSIGAIFAGFLVVVVLSIATDAILEATGVFGPPSQGLFTLWMILLAIAYRTIFTVAGGYVAAMLAPSRPMRHAVILGILGTVIGTLAAIATIPINLSPAWYPIALAVLALPSSWFGGKLYEQRGRSALLLAGIQ